MELGTFGAIMSFALELEERASRFYEEAAKGRLEETFRQLAQTSRKRLKRLERARRELVSEMILESITGLDGDDYRVDLRSGGDEAGLVCQAEALEDAAVCFYQDAADKMPIREIARLFRQLARENEGCKARLVGL